MTELAGDLAAESAELRALLADLPDDPTGWGRPTPAVGWSVRDQISHLAYFDDVAIRSATDPDGFADDLARMLADGGVDPDRIAARFRTTPGPELLAWFDSARSRLITVFGALDPAVRVPWFGPAMSAASSLTARIMETWAHGQDVADALGVRRPPTARLRHVAHIGVGARRFSYAAHGRIAPDAPIRVDLAAPDGERWTWGPPDAPDRITGPALDFCLLVTQRRHRADTELAVTGRYADEWLSIAQAFAGPPGPGRLPTRASAPNQAGAR